jgi:GT2 family glycosyltransferase
MKLTSAAIIVSNNPERIEECLQYVAKQTVPFDRIIIIAWSRYPQQKQEIVNRATCTIKNVEIVEPRNDTRLESNRNKAITYLARNPTDSVAFLDDDIFLDERWHEAMQRAAKYDGDTVSHATLVVFKSNRNLVQSAGHILNNTKPLDLGYKKQKVTYLSKTEKPLCPCGNCAFVPWSAIEQIQKIDPEIWDPNFDKWQTCFDFGLKLRLCGYDCHLVPSARAIHEGYLDKSVRGQKLKEKDIKNQLKSRLLLYSKFFSKDERKGAMRILEESVNRWSQNGYPHAEDHIRGDCLKCLLKCAQSEAKDLLEITSDVWLKLVNRLDVQSRRRLLFGGL